MAMRDIQNEKDLRGKKITKVGVNNIQVPISILQGNDNTPTKTVATVSIYTSLAKEARGANMSRYSELLHEAIENHLGTKIIEDLLQKIRTKLESNDSYIKFRFNYFLKKTSPVSGRKSYMAYNCTLEGRGTGDKDRIYLTVNVPYTSLCPCSKSISTAGAHNQRSMGKVTIEIKKDTFIDIKELIKVVENCASCEMFTTLKRTDEKYVTEHAYNNPKFVEDMVRDIAVKLDSWLDNKINDYSVVVEHYEAIHDHDAVAIVNAGRNLK